MHVCCVSIQHSGPGSIATRLLKVSEICQTNTDYCHIDNTYFVEQNECTCIQHSAIVLQGWSNGNKARAQASPRTAAGQARNGGLFGRAGRWKRAKKTHPPNNHSPQWVMQLCFAVLCGRGEGGRSLRAEARDSSRPPPPPVYRLRCRHLFFAVSEMDSHISAEVWGLRFGRCCPGLGGALRGAFLVA